MREWRHGMALAAAILLPAASLAVGAPAPAAAVASCSVSGGSSRLVVATDRGAVRGSTADGVDAWKGIPYAAPPVGTRRWLAPAPHACWRGVMAATAFGAPCAQLDVNGALVGKEDCLTLNVWRPSGGSGARPVMVFLHGGGHVQGSTSQVTAGVTLYDGATLAGKGRAVVVTLEYRLGQLGWLAADALREGGRPPGNYGLLDEIAALEWVKANIARFGGDPDRVLLFGESAGAVDTCLLVSSPRARGLFSRALIESGGCVAADPTDARRSATDFVQSTGCASSSTVAACLRALPVTTVLGAAPGAVALTSLGRPKYGPYVDGRILPSAPLDRIRAGEANQVPVVVGSNEDETALFVGDVPTAAAYGSALTHTVGRHVAQQILAEYPVTEFPSPRAALVAATTDAMFTCPTGDAERAFVAGQRKPVYRYFYTHAPETGPLRFVGAFHGAELFSVFGHLDTNEATPTASEQQLSDTVIGYWSRFAATGDPNGGGAPQWPASTRGSDRYLQVDTALKAGAGVRTAQCRFWAHLRG